MSIELYNAQNGQCKAIVYLSWNSGVSCKNSRPGWDNRMPAIIDFRSSGATYRQLSFLRISNMRRTGSTWNQTTVRSSEQMLQCLRVLCSTRLLSTLNIKTQSRIVRCSMLLLDMFMQEQRVVGKCLDVLWCVVMSTIGWSNQGPNRPHSVY